MRGAFPVGFVIVLLLLLPVAAFAGVSLFPEGRAFPALLADPREPRFGFDWVEGGFVSAHAGRSIALARSGAHDLCIDGMLWGWLRQRAGFNFPLETVDGSFGMALESRHGAFATRLRYGHVSSHLADGDRAIERNRIGFSRETVSWIAAYTGSRRLTAYAGPTFMLRGEPDAPAFQVQAGGEVRFRAGAARGLIPYAALDLRMKSENAQRVNQSYELGVRLAQGRSFPLRVAAGYTTGHSERGQLWRRAESFFRLGVALGD